MAKNKISEFSAVAANNTDIANIDIAEGCAPSGINNAIRELMAQLKDQQTGTDLDNFTVGGNLVVTGTATFTGGLSTDLAVVDGGTGASTAADARTNLGLGTIATQSAATVAITGGTITGITDITVADGGTGVSTLSANAVLLGNGASALQTVAPSTSGNVLTSNGTTWTSAAASGIGVGQTWQVVTRAFATDYTNSTGKPIMLAGKFSRNATSTANIDLIIGGVQVPLARNTNSNGGNESAGSLIIPNSTVYQLVNVGEALSSFTIYELR